MNDLTIFRMNGAIEDHGHDLMEKRPSGSIVVCTCTHNHPVHGAPRRWEHTKTVFGITADIVEEAIRTSKNEKRFNTGERVIQVSVTQPFLLGEGWTETSMSEVRRLVAKKMGYKSPLRDDTAARLGIPAPHFAELFPDAAIDDEEVVKQLNPIERIQLFQKMPYGALEKYGDLITDNQVFSLVEKLVSRTRRSWSVVPVERLSNQEVAALVKEYSKNEGCLSRLGSRLSDDQISALAKQVQEEETCYPTWSEWIGELFSLVESQGEGRIEQVFAGCPWALAKYKEQQGR